MRQKLTKTACSQFFLSTVLQNTGNHECSSSLFYKLFYTVNSLTPWAIGGAIISKFSKIQETNFWRCLWDAIKLYVLFYCIMNTSQKCYLTSLEKVLKYCSALDGHLTSARLPPKSSVHNRSRAFLKYNPPLVSMCTSCCTHLLIKSLCITKQLMVL